MANNVGTDMEAELAKLFRDAMVKAFPAVARAMPKMLITTGKETEYQCNNAMGLTKLLSQQTPPIKMSTLDVATAITDAVDKSSGLVSEAIPTKQGFINISIGREYISQAVTKLVRDGVAPPAVKKQKILVDFSSPNIAKVMHVGHLRSTIIGDSICRLLEFCGHDVHRINHVGDWGTQFGMLIAHLKSESPDFLTNPPDITDLVSFYKAAKQRFDDDADFKSVSHQEVVKLQSGDETNIKAWTMICDISRKEFSTIYDKLDIKLKEVGESYYNPIIPKVLQILSDQGLVKDNEGAKIITSVDWKDVKKLGKNEPEKVAAYYLVNPKSKVEKLNPVLGKVAVEVGAAKEEDGALLVKVGKAFKPVAQIDNEDADKFLKEMGKALKPLHADIIAELEKLGAAKDGQVAVPVFNIPLIVTKSDGGYSYDTTDMAAAWYRTQDLKVDRAIYVTDLGQEGHFHMIFRAAKDAGWLTRADQPDIRMDHVGFGVVQGPDKKKYKTRSGTTANLGDLLDEGTQNSYNISVKRQEDKQKEAEEKEAKGELREKFVPFTEEELREISTTVGLGAIKYCDLRQNRTNDYIFDAAKMCSLEGNTAMAMLYTYARCCAIARKAGVDDLDALRKATSIELVTEGEKKLALCLLRFPSVIEKTCDNLMPHNITDYLYNLVQRYGEFYHEKDEKVIGSPRQASKLLICDATKQTLEKGLQLLGIKTLSKI